MTSAASDFVSTASSSAATAQNILFDVRPGEVSFSFGAPDESLLRQIVPVLKQATIERLEADPDAYTLLQYGPIAGDAVFINQLAAFLRLHYNDPHVDATHLMATAGASQGLSFACTHLMKPGDPVLIEDPTYFLAEQLILEHHLKTVGVRTDDDGINVEDLEKQLKAIPIKNPSEGYSAMLYLVPTFSNPRGTTISHEKRQRIVALAHQYNVIVVCDDVYELLCYKGAQPPVPRLFSYDAAILRDTPAASKRGHVISNASFSKIFGPGVRLGWIEAWVDIQEKLTNTGFMASGGGVQHCMSGLMGTAIQNGSLDRVIAALQAAYGARMAAVCAKLRQAIPAGVVNLIEPQGGLFMWVEFRDTAVDTEALLARARREFAVGFQPGNRFSQSKTFGHCMRLGIAFHPEAELLSGVDRLARLIHASIADGSIRVVP